MRHWLSKKRGIVMLIGRLRLIGLVRGYVLLWRGCMLLRRGWVVLLKRMCGRGLNLELGRDNGGLGGQYMGRHVMLRWHWR